ncbi:MAG: hypothetical protein JO321_12595, partial [Solirubrobacterales bacterium]|nr:hypothetical protein [Solirubrobacterales bacterium]
MNREEREPRAGAEAAPTTIRDAGCPDPDAHAISTPHRDAHGVAAPDPDAHAALLSDWCLEV